MLFLQILYKLSTFKKIDILSLNKLRISKYLQVLILEYCLFENLFIFQFLSTLFLGWLFSIRGATIIIATTYGATCYKWLYTTCSISRFYNSICSSIKNLLLLLTNHKPTTTSITIECTGPIITTTTVIIVVIMTKLAATAIWKWLWCEGMSI